jgi:hypothetical protein
MASGFSIDMDEGISFALPSFAAKFFAGLSRWFAAILSFQGENHVRSKISQDSSGPHDRLRVAYDVRLYA